METIPSFQVDHTLIVPGIYVSRIDAVGGDFATTFDVRMKRPNVERAISPAAMHTIEHVVATFLRNDPVWKERLRDWDEEIPGATAVNCGNYTLHDLTGAKAEAALFVQILQAQPSFEYPLAPRAKTGRGEVFHDS